MSRAVVLKTISKLSDLLDQEDGKDTMVGGSGRRRPIHRRGGAMIPYGAGLESFPGQFGRGGSYVAGKITHSAKQLAAAKSNPWIRWVKDTARLNGSTYGEALADPITSYGYQEAKAAKEAMGEHVPKRKSKKVAAGRRRRY